MQGVFFTVVSMLYTCTYSLCPDGPRTDGASPLATLFTNATPTLYHQVRLVPSTLGLFFALALDFQPSFRFVVFGRFLIAVILMLTTARSCAVGQHMKSRLGIIFALSVPRGDM